jgi:poly-gamma-glutamate synthesis protein (capsule biosynthesis protein)
VVVTFHWGTEYTSQPSAQTIAIAHDAIDTGADLIIGNHPHWIQPVEIYKGKVITYAHGNFVFDQMWSMETRHGVVGKYTFYNNKIVDVQFIPVQIDNYGQPYVLDGTAKESILTNMYAQAQKLL